MLRDAGDYAGAKALMERVLSLHYADAKTDQDLARIALRGQQGLSRRHPLYAERLQELGDLCMGLGISIARPRCLNRRWRLPRNCSDPNTRNMPFG